MPNVLITVGIQQGQLKGVLIGLHDQKDFKTAVSILKFLKTLGYQSMAYDDYHEIRRRTYHLKHDDERGENTFVDGKYVTVGNLKVSIFLAGSEGSSCRFEQVGTKEIPVYKVVCDGHSEIVM